MCCLGQTGLTRIGPCQVRDQIRHSGSEREGIEKIRPDREAGSGTTTTLVSKSGYGRVPSKEPLIDFCFVKADLIGHGPRVGDDEVRTTRRRGCGPGCSQVRGREVLWNYVCTRLPAVEAAERERGRFDEADWACESRAREMVGLVSVLEVHVHDGYYAARCRCCRCRRAGEATSERRVRRQATDEW